MRLLILEWARDWSLPTCPPAHPCRYDLRRKSSACRHGQDQSTSDLSSLALQSSTPAAILVLWHCRWPAAATLASNPRCIPQRLPFADLPSHRESHANWAFHRGHTCELATKQSREYHLHVSQL